MAKAFTKEFISEMKTALLEEQRRLGHELSQMGKVDPKNPANFTPHAPVMTSGDEDNAAEATTYSDNIAVAEELKGALKDVVSALGRIEKGTYGVCKYCAQPIDERRLRARPASASCINCKKQMTQEA